MRRGGGGREGEKKEKQKVEDKKFKRKRRRRRRETIMQKLREFTISRPTSHLKEVVKENCVRQKYGSIQR